MGRIRVSKLSTLLLSLIIIKLGVEGYITGIQFATSNKTIRSDYNITLVRTSPITTNLSGSIFFERLAYHTRVIIL